MAFVHLHRHGEFSRLDGIGTATQYAERAVFLGQGALSLTDHGTMSGALHHIAACRKAGIVPIVGVEAYFRPSRANKFTRQAWHLCLYAKNLKGWHNLMRLVSISHAEIEDGGGFYQYPCVDTKILRTYREGIVASSACFRSWLAHLISQGDSVAVRSHIDTMQNIFGDDFWIEIMPHDFNDQRALNITLVGIAAERGIPVIATNDAHFPYKDWAETQRVAKIMGVGKTLVRVAKDVECGKADYLSELTPSLYLAHEEEMRFWFERRHTGLSENVVNEAIENTNLFAQRIVPFMLDTSPKLPKIPDLTETPEETLRGWIRQGMIRLRLEYPPAHWERYPQREYSARVLYEFEILKSKGVIDYFVMLGDVIRWAKAEGIRVGLGRGSAAGCLISYLIGITAIDPISYGLLFERFLNPARKGLPDIDVDFDSERRHEVKAYLSRKYGADHVADIITHQRFQPKKVIGDLARVYGVSLPESLAVTESIDIRPDDEETKLEEILPLNEKLQAFKSDHPEIWEHALRLEGTVANAGKHAAGIVVTPEPVAEYMALERGKKGDLVTSWSDAADFAAISDNGYLKYDFLGITGLSMHEYACKLIEEQTGERIDLNKLPVLRDPLEADDDVLRLFAEGYTVGIFQFASRGITGLLRDIEPDTALDLIAANALYRPGPMKGGVTWEYAKRKHNIFLRTYWNDEVRPVLSETYGLIVYQEQVMKIAQELGGFSGAEADDMRKAMGKLYRIKGGRAAKDFMGQFRKKWFVGCSEHGISREVADEIWHKMLEFGHYGFNRSHSACYALQAYQDAYLKAKYPAAFYAARMTYEDDDEIIKATLREARMRGLEIVLPNVNESQRGYTIDKKGRLVLGLEGIKGIGPNASAEIIRKRPFTSFADLLERGGPKIPVKPLIEAGAVDGLADRQALLSLVPRPCGPKKLREHEQTGEPLPLWTVYDHMKHNLKLKVPRELPEIFDQPELEELERIQGQLLNLPLASLNMTDAQQEYIGSRIYMPDELVQMSNGAAVVIGGEVVKVTKKKTKKGNLFANVSLVFGQHEWAAKFWSDQLATYEKLLKPGKVLMIAGRKDEWNGWLSVVAGMVTDIEALDVDAILEDEREEEIASPS